MVVLRCTKKLLTRLSAPSLDIVPKSSTALGEWYLTILSLRPAHLILAVSEASRLPVLLPAKELRTLHERLPDALAEVLQSLGIPAAAIGRERAAMSPAAFAPTASRSVLGTINDFVFALEAHRASGSRESLLEISLWLAETPVKPLGYDCPEDVTRRILTA